MARNRLESNAHKSFENTNKQPWSILLRIGLILYLIVSAFFKGVSHVEINKDGDSFQHYSVDSSYWSVFHSVEQLASKLEVWEHNDMIGFPICRLERICRTENGVFLLPSWLKQYDSLLETCGLNQSSLLFVQGHENILKRFRNSYFDKDLMGIEPTRWQLPHFMADTLWIAVWRHFLHHSASRRTSMWDWKCLHPSSRPCITTLYWSALKPVFLMTEAFKQEEWTKMYWKYHLYRMTTLEENPILSSAERCFRSVTWSKIRPANIPSRLFNEANTFFVENGIARKDRLKSTFQVAREKGHCFLKIALKQSPELSRSSSPAALEDDSPNSFLGEVAFNIANMKRHLVPERFVSKIQVDIVNFSISSLDDLDAAKLHLQTVDAVITDHSIANSQFMFLRPNTTILEILPFAYNALMYRDLATSVGLDYYSIFSDPDEETFIDCIEKLESNRSALEYLKSAYRMEKQRWKNENYQQELHLETSHVANAISKSRYCARQQRIHTNVSQIVIFTMQRVLTPCLSGLWYHEKDH
eukprot:jgi/Galph1/5322/GphlegSOOS_G3914.1